MDIGASSTKLVLLGESGAVLSRIVRHSGVDYSGTAQMCLDEALAEAGADANQIAFTISTGYGRTNAKFADKSMTEIHCHGLGCYDYAKRAISIIDIGGQDNKVIRLTETGNRANFKMNRKCAAGTGAFIEEVALRLGLQLEEMDPLAREAMETTKLSSFCTVFAKTEILAHLRKGEPVSGIVRGAFEAVVMRVVEMDALGGDVLLTGGVVAHNPTIVDLISQKIGRPAEVPPHPQFTGALGAALSARQQANDERPA